MIRWITARLGTGAYRTVNAGAYDVLDVRDLVDGKGNADDHLWQKIADASDALAKGRTVVACCDYGISRSNSIAIAVLARAQGMSFTEAQRIVMARTGEKEMRLDILNHVRRVFERRHAAPDDSASEVATLVTGASGSIGQAVCTALRQVLPVIPLSSSQLDLTQGAVSLDLLVKESNARHIVHLAHPRRSGTNNALGASITMLKNVMDVCVENGLHLTYVSSWEVFSSRGCPRFDAPEQAVRCPESMVGLSKALGENLLEALPAGQLSYAIVRPARLYGSKTSYPRVLWNIGEACIKHGAVSLHRFHNGFALLDFVHVDDFAAGLKDIVRQNKSGVFHFGGGAAFTTRQLVDQFAAVLGKPCRVDERAIQGWAPNVALSSTRAGHELEWEPRRRLGDALAHAVDEIERQDIK